MAVPTFECMPIPSGHFAGGDPHYFTVDEADAVAWAKANATRDREQVTVEACAPGDVSTFAIRHLKHDGTDTGWRGWRDGTCIGSTSIDRLFNLDRVVT